jgi:uncharacterized protein (TIRG00374 family)
VSVRLLRLLLLAGGLAAVVWLIWDLRPAAVWEAIHTLSWRLGLVVLVPFCVAVTLDTLGWRVLLPECRVPWRTLAAARLAGEAVNLLTPTASVGGEPLKAYLVRDRLPLDEGLASVVVDKTTMVMGQAAFLAASLVVALLALEPSRTVTLAMVALLAVEIVGVSGFAMVQIRGGIAGAGRILHRLGVGRAESHEELLRDVDRRLRRLYRERRARVLLSALLHTLGWALGGLEIYVVLTLADTGEPRDRARSRSRRLCRQVRDLHDSGLARRARGGQRGRLRSLRAAGRDGAFRLPRSPTTRGDLGADRARSPGVLQGPAQGAGGPRVERRGRFRRRQTLW